MNIKPLLRFVKERWKIHLKKDILGEPKPWTRDLILGNYRFTQVRREDDKVTVWIRENWREPHKQDDTVWFAMCVARYFNWPATLEMIGYPCENWNAKRVVKMLNAHVQRKETRLFEKSHKGMAYKIERVKRSYKPQVFGGAYFLNSIGPKIESIVFDRLDPLWKRRKEISEQVRNCETLAELYEVFKAQHGFGSFMAAQIVADLKYTPRFELAPDWWSWAASGPGSKRGLNRLCDRPVNAPWKEEEWHENLLELQRKVNAELEKIGIPKLHAQDVQGICCCEWDKYERARLGEGRPKTKYAGGL